MAHVIVIGGGAAGMAAAIAAAACSDQVTILERMDRVGKKILATGNGRCNLMNTGIPRFPGSESFAKQVLTRFGQEEQQRFWQHLGLRLRQEEGGRVYPVSGQASTVLDTLRFTLEAMNVQVITGVHVDGVFKARHGWTVMSGENKWKGDRVIIAGGGCAQPKLGSDGSCWRLLTEYGHTLIDPRPALTQILTDQDPIRGLSGIRVRCSVGVHRSGAVQYRESGELLFADYGVSGVCVMQCARYVQPGDELRIRLTGSLGFESLEDVRDELFRRKAEWSNRPMTELLSGLFVPKLAMALMQYSRVASITKRNCGSLCSGEIKSLIDTIDELVLTVKGVKGFESAQVTAGGLSTDEFDPATLESIHAPGLHAAGEVLDVDGDCGGFNLMFAFGSGVLAGLNGRNTPW